MGIFRKLLVRYVYGLNDHQLVYIDGTTTVLKTQSMLGGQDLHRAAEADPWVAGYVYGAHCALLQNLGVEPGPTAIDYLETSYGFVFGTKAEGVRMLKEAFGLQKTPLFDTGHQVGGDDVFRWLSTQQPTMMLACRLRGD